MLRVGVDVGAGNVGAGNAGVDRSYPITNIRDESSIQKVTWYEWLSPSN